MAKWEYLGTVVDLFGVCRAVTIGRCVVYIGLYLQCIVSRG